ncbi:MAG: tetratricopeptide repeat protein [Gammaproteobacteria bacterium]|nr:tetratricopeptide repeat protein [Gammaproteobacteria bacterium]
MQTDPSQDQLNTLANLYQSGQMTQVVSSCKELLPKYKRSLVLYNILGSALQAIGRFEEAIKSYKQAIQIYPDYVDAHYNLGNTLKELGMLDEAVKSYKKAIQLKPDYVEVYNNLGVVLKDLNQLENSIQSCVKAIQLNPNYAEAYNNLGVTLQELGRLDEAVKSYNKATQLKPDYAEAYSNFGATLQELGRLDEAVKRYNQAIQIDPNYAEAYSNLGVVQKELEMLDEAVKSCNKAIQLNPDYVEAYNNLGNTLKELGMLDEAVKSYKKAIQLKPNYIEAHFNESLVLLSLGDFSHGWEKYEYGKLNKKRVRRLTQAPYQEWNGEALEGKKIIITTEQGVGDEVMFASCIPDIINQHPKQVVIECDYRLVPLFKRSFKQAVVVERKERSKADWLNEVGVMDFKVSIGSLPKFFRQELSDFSSRQSFLIPNDMLRTKWKQRYNELGEGIKIGISWTGGAKGSTKKSAATTLKQWIPLFKKNAFFINLQYGEYSDDLRQLEESTGVHIYDWDDADPLTDLDNQAAQIAELDLVISFTNSTIHIAGSVGTPTWVLLTFVPDFRWILNRKDSPWYLSVKSFRQQQYGDWENVFSQVENELDMLIQ